MILCASGRNCLNDGLIILFKCELTINVTLSVHTLHVFFALSILTRRNTQTCNSLSSSYMIHIPIRVFLIYGRWISQRMTNQQTIYLENPL